MKRLILYVCIDQGPLVVHLNITAYTLQACTSNEVKTGAQACHNFLATVVDEGDQGEKRAGLEEEQQAVGTPSDGVRERAARLAARAAVRARKTEQDGGGGSGGEPGGQPGSQVWHVVWSSLWRG